MEEIVRLIRVFLASPGDLQEERSLANDAVDELNKSIAYYLGFRIELKGWEDTLPGHGRPQEIINQELDRCELFIGIMWKKWGTPPDTQGKYTSGFEEEFERSSDRFMKTGLPEVAMYFKEIPKEFLVDKGEDLKKVISFRDRIISEKRILFDRFRESNEFQKCVRLKITDYLLKLKEAEVEELEEKQSKAKIVTQNVESTQNKELVKSPFSKEGHIFLKHFLDKTEAEDSAKNITAFEVARLRLLSNAISKQGNHLPSLGVHDANIIFRNKSITYGDREILSLIDCGLKNIKHENSPLWYWCSLYKLGSLGEYLAHKSFSSADKDIGAGALEVMKLIDAKLPEEDDGINRNIFINFYEQIILK